jgi:hypothetical protein
MLYVTEGVNRTALYLDIEPKSDFSVSKSASFLVASEALAVVGIVYHSMAICKQILYKLASSLSLPTSAPLSNSELFNKHLKPLEHSVLAALQAPINCLVQNDKGKTLRTNAKEILPGSSNSGLLSHLKAHQGTILMGALAIGACVAVYGAIAASLNIPEATSTPPDHSYISDLALDEQTRLTSIWERVYAACNRAHGTFTGVTGKDFQCTIYRDSGASSEDYASAARSINDLEKELPGLSWWLQVNKFTGSQTHKRDKLPLLFCDGGTAEMTYKWPGEFGQTHTYRETWLEDAWPRLLRGIKTFASGNDGCGSYQKTQHCSQKEGSIICAADMFTNNIELFERP